MDRTGRVRGRNRGLQPAARTGVDPTLNLVGVAGRWTGRRIDRRPRVHPPRARGDRGYVDAVPGRTSTAMGRRCRSRRRGGGGRRRAARGVVTGPDVMGAYAVTRPLGGEIGRASCRERV